MEIRFTLLLKVYKLQLNSFVRVCFNISNLYQQKQIVLQKQGYHINFVKHFLNSFTDTQGIVKHNIGLKILLQQGISEPIVYDYLVYKFKIILEHLFF